MHQYSCAIAVKNKKIIGVQKVYSLFLCLRVEFIEHHNSLYII